MQQTIQKITQNFIDQLPENDQYYRVDKLRSLGFPSFLVRRISVEMKRNLADTLTIPQSDWINTHTDTVLDAWQKFIDAITSEARLPASYAKAVTENAVSDLLEILVRPRKSIPDIIFGSEEELSVAKLRANIQSIVVYRHFKVLLLRYVEKKELQVLTKEQCAKIIKQSDEKLTSDYSPLDWAQLLEPLFQLKGGEVDTPLLRLFFEDKNKPQIARKFDLMDTVLSRAEFIEALSSPEMLDFEGYGDDQSSLFEEEQSLSTPEVDSQESSEDSESDNEKYDSETPSPEEQPLDLEKDQDKPVDDETINDSAETDPKNQKEKEFEVEGSGNVNDEDDSNIQEEEVQKSPPVDDVEISSSQNEMKDTEKDQEERPIWMRFMSDEEIEEYKKQQAEEENADEDGFIEKPIIDLTQQDATDEEVEKLRKALSSDRELFVEEIFRGSDRAFEEAVEDIAGYDSWRDVSKYIENDIFKRNLVDMYSEPAVDFTDRLQSYFLKKQNRN